MDFYTTAILQGLGFCFLSAGIYLSLRIFNIPDITADGSYTFGGAITAVMLMHGATPLVAFPVAVAGGAAAGVCTGLIHTKLKVPALLAGILVMTALYSVNLSLMGRSNIPLIEAHDIFGGAPGNPAGLSATAWVFILFVMILFVLLTWLLYTDFGIAMRATGSNETMARASGVNTNRYKITGLAVANGFIAVSGFLMTQYQGFCDINMGIGIVISGLASVFLGSTLARMVRARKLVIEIACVMAGTILFRLVLAGALSAGLDPNYLKLVTALLVLAILAAGAFVRKEIHD